MKRSPRSSLAVCLVVAFLLAGTGPPSARAEDIRRGGQVVIGIKGDPPTLNPILASDQSSRYLTDQIFSALLRRDRDENIIPDLAESWEVSMEAFFSVDTAAISLPDARKRLEAACAEGKGPFQTAHGVSIDGDRGVMVRTSAVNPGIAGSVEALLGRGPAPPRLEPVFAFHLRRTAKWHDGYPFTSDDVTFTVRSVLDPRNHSHLASDFDWIQTVEAPDLYTLKVRYKEPRAQALELWLNRIILPEHLLSGVDLTATRFNRHPIGTGPFHFSEWVVDDHLLLAAYNDFHLGRPNLDHVVFRVVPNESNLFVELLSGNVDVMELKQDQFDKAANNPEFASAFQRYTIPERNYTYLGYNLGRGLFDDPRTRRALTMAIDREGLIKRALRGYGRQLSGPFLPASWEYDASVQPLPYDPAAARALLREAGWEDRDGDGILERDMGDHVLQFRFTIATNAGRKDRELAAEEIAQELSAIGIAVQVRYYEWSRFLDNVVDRRDFDAILLAWGLNPDPDSTRQVWSARDIPDPATGRRGLNATGFVDPVVEGLFERGGGLLDREVRRPLYHEIHRRIAEAQPYTFLYINDTLYAASRRVGGIVETTNGIIRDLHHWFVRESNERVPAARAD